MNKFLSILLAFSISSFSIYAQSQNTQMEMQTLVQRIDSLEHELAYLNLTYDLDKIHSDIKILSNEVYSRSIEVKLEIYNTNFDSELGDYYQRYYESCMNNTQSLYKLIESKKELFILKIITHHYSERELNVLMASYEIIDKEWEVLETSMNLLLTRINIYRKNL